MKRVLSVSIALVIVMTCISACSKTKLPNLESASRYSDEQLDRIVQTVDENDLIKAWGEPSVVDNERLWTLDLTGQTKYMVAYIGNGKVISLNVSQILFINVVEEENSVLYCIFDWNNYSTDARNLAFMPTQDRFGNALSCEVGDQILFESNGMVAETHPAQLAALYSYTIMGHLSDSEISDIAMNIELP